MVRGDVDLFDCTEKVRSAGPCPVVGPLKVTQSDSARAVHSHSLAIATLSVPDPPADDMAAPLSVTAAAHLCVEGPVGVTEVLDDEPQPAATATSKDNEMRRAPAR